MKRTCTSSDTDCDDATQAVWTLSSSASAIVNGHRFSLKYHNGERGILCDMGPDCKRVLFNGNRTLPYDYDSVAAVMTCKEVG